MARSKRDMMYSALPQINYAGYAAQARESQALSQSMNRVVSFAAKQSAYESEKAGTEYGAEKAPTPQQVKDALANGIDLDEIMPGGGGDFTVFDRAAGKAALISVTNAVEAEARASISQLQREAYSNKTPIIEVQAEMRNIIDGYGASLAGISPGVAKKFNASMSIAGNTVINAHAKYLNTVQDKANKAMAAATASNIIGSIPDIINNPVIVTETGFVTANELLANERQAIADLGFTNNDPAFITKQLKIFDDAVSEAKVGRIVDFVLLNPLANRKAMESGKKPPGVKTEDFLSLRQTFTSMTDQEKRTAKTQASNAFTRQLAEESSIDAALDRETKDQIDTLELQIFEARTAGDQTLVDNLMDELEGISPSAALKIEESIYASAGMDDPATVEQLEFMRLDGTLRKQDLVDARKAGTITLATLTRLAGIVQSSLNSETAAAINYAKNKVGYPPPSLIRYSTSQIRARRQVATIENQLTVAIRNDPNIDRLKFVQDLLANLKEDAGPTSAQVTAAQTSLLGQRQVLGLNENASYEDVIEALKEQGKDETFQAVIDRAEYNGQ